MNTYRHLYTETLSDENIEAAIKEAYKHTKTKNKRKKEELRKLKNKPNRVKIVRGWIQNYETRKCKPKEIYDGISHKVRQIYIPTLKETVIQHAIVRILDKYLSCRLYEHTYAAIKKRGGLAAKKQIEKWIRKHPKDFKYYLKMDVRQYFPSIPQDKLMDKLSRYIKDYRFLELIRKVISATDHGIPLGFYISQWLANFYLTDLDHYIKQELGVKIYIRWMDDMVITSSNKRKLHRIRLDIELYLGSEGLEMKGNWRVQLFSYGEKPGEKRSKGCFLDFMGYRFYRKRTTLRESIFYRMTRKARRISRKAKPTIYDIRQFISYIGWLKYTDTYDAYKEYISPLVSIQSMKRRISRYERKERANVKSGLQKGAGLQAAA